MCDRFAWVKPLGDKRATTVFDGFIGIVNEAKRKPNKSWVYQGKGFYNKLMQNWLENKNISMYSTYNRGNSEVSERFIRTSKGKI